METPHNYITKTISRNIDVMNKLNTIYYIVNYIPLVSVFIALTNTNNTIDFFQVRAIKNCKTGFANTGIVLGWSAAAVCDRGLI